MQRRCNGGNKYASLGIMHEHKETTCDEWLTIHLQPEEEQFVLYRLMKQIKALSDHIVAIEVANNRCHQPTPRFMDEDDMVTFSGARSQWRKLWFDKRSPWQANLIVIRDPQIHLPNPSYVEEEDDFVKEEFHEYDFIDEKFKHGDVHKDLEHEDVEDPSQWFLDLDLDSPPTYKSDINDEDLVRGSLSYDHEEEPIVDWDIYPQEDESLEKVNLSNNIENFVDESSIHHARDGSPKSEVFNLDVNWS